MTKDIKMMIAIKQTGKIQNRKDVLSIQKNYCTISLRGKLNNI